MRRTLLLLLVVTPSLAFDWPGETYRIGLELGHSEPAQRKELVRRLAEFDAESVKEPLLRALEDPEPQVRLEAAAVAGRVRLREAVPILLDWLDDPDKDTRATAAQALGRMREARALPALLRALGDSQGDVRRAAVLALNELPSEETVAPLIGRLEDADLGVRIEAIAALGQRRDARAVVPLLSSTADGSAEVRGAAIDALGLIGDARALPALLRALGDETESVQLAAAAAIGRVGDASAVRALKAALERAEPRLGQAILAALANIDDAAAREVLIAALLAPELRRAAVGAVVRQAQRMGAATATTTATATATSASSLLGSLVRVVDSEAEVAVKVAAVEAIARSAEFVDANAAVEPLAAALPAAQGELATALMQALAASGAPGALVPLLERLAQAEGALLDDALVALARYFDRAAPDSRAADPLLERLPRAERAQQVLIATLLGRVRAERAVPALTGLFTHKDGPLRLAALGAAEAIAAAEANAALLPLLDSPDAATRLAAARALRATADAAALDQLVTRLAGGDAQDRSALMLALGAGLGRAERRGALQPELAKRALAALKALVRDPDDALSDGAADALAVWQPKEALKVLALNLRSPSSRRRAVAIAAIGQLDTQDARKTLRYLLRGGSPRETAAAAIGLAELGDERDTRALAKTAARRHWPVPGAAAYAFARIAQRGQLRPHAATRDLCALGGSREPYVRANVAAALAALGAGACDQDGPDPLRWLEPEHAPIVRAAAAHWARAGAASGRLPADAVTAALERCAERDVEQSVRAACAAPPRRGAGEPADVYAYQADGATLMRDRMVALRTADATVFLGYTDANGHVRLRYAAPGELRLENPALQPLEPR